MGCGESDRGIKKILSFFFLLYCPPFKFVDVLPTQEK